MLDPLQTSRARRERYLCAAAEACETAAQVNDAPRLGGFAYFRIGGLSVCARASSCDLNYDHTDRRREHSRVRRYNKFAARRAVPSRMTSWKAIHRRCPITKPH